MCKEEYSEKARLGGLMFEKRFEGKEALKWERERRERRALYIKELSKYSTSGCHMFASLPSTTAGIMNRGSGDGMISETNAEPDNKPLPVSDTYHEKMCTTHQLQRSKLHRSV
jgi:hypothetical protein